MSTADKGGYTDGGADPSDSAMITAGTVHTFTLRNATGVVGFLDSIATLIY